MQDEMNDLQYTKEEDPDILKVCRCKDCKWWDESTESDFRKCHKRKRTSLTHKDGYCSDGERKDA